MLINMETLQRKYVTSCRLGESDQCFEGGMYRGSWGRKEFPLVVLDAFGENQQGLSVYYKELGYFVTLDVGHFTAELCDTLVDFRGKWNRVAEVASLCRLQSGEYETVLWVRAGRGHEMVQLGYRLSKNCWIPQLGVHFWYISKGCRHDAFFKPITAKQVLLGNR